MDQLSFSRERFWSIW